MKTTMVGVCLAWAVFAFVFYRGYYLRWLRHSDYAEFARVTFAAVLEHFAELRAKREIGVVDKGFKMIDESAWRETVSTFVTNVVMKQLKPSTRERIKKSQGVSTSFTTFADHFVSELTTHEVLPDHYDLDAFIRTIENDTDVVAFLNGEAKYLPGKAYVSRLTALLLAVGLLAHGQPTYAEGAAFTPLDACNALADVPGFQVNTSGYSELYEGVYSCATPYKELSTGGLPNNLAMYGRGDSNSVTRVKIMLNVNQAARAARDQKVLGDVCTQMITNLVGEPPAGFAKRVAQGKPFEDSFDGYRVFLEKNVWTTGKGFELNCGIATMDHKE
ncbi:hypothetical protein D3C81_455210 [compost metagenome]